MVEGAIEVLKGVEAEEVHLQYQLEEVETIKSKYSEMEELLRTPSMV